MMYRVKVFRSACWRCLRCEKPGRMPGLVTRMNGNVLVAESRISELEVAWKISAAIDSCVTNAINLEVVP